MGKTSCKKGQYYCNTDKKCKPIPDGYEVREDGFLVKEGWSDKYKKSINCDNPKGFSQKAHCDGKKKKSLGEASSPRIPRKKGQPAKSKKHSDLYTDEDPKGTIHGLGFKDVAKAKASVSKIRNSSRSHAHKIQAAVAMEQRAREMGKTSEAAVYRKYINAMKKKTKRMNEDKRTFGKFKKIIKNEPSRAVVSSDKGRPLDKNPRINVTNDKLRVPGDGSNARLTTDKMRVKGDGSNSKLTVKEAANPAQQAAIAIDMKKKGKRPMTMKESVAVTELEDGLKNLKVITYDSVDQLMQGVAKRNGMSETLLHNQFKAKHFQIPDDWAVRYRMNKRKGIEEEKMTPAEKRKDTMLKKKYDKSDMKKSMQKQYGKEEGKKVYFATIRKQAMQEVAPVLPAVAADQTFNDGEATSAAIDHNKKLLGIGQKKKPTVTKKITTGARTAGVKEEYITELSPSTLGSYIKKAKISLRDASADLAGGATRTGTPLMHLRKIRKRSLGIDRATDKLVNKATPTMPPDKVTRLFTVKPNPNAPKKNGKLIDASDRFGKKNEEYDKYNVSEEGLRDWFNCK